MGSVPRKMALGLESVSVQCTEIIPVSPDSLQLTLTTKPWIRVNLMKKKVYYLKFFSTCNLFFCIQDCCSQIAQVEYQGQARNTRILEHKPLIDTFYCIWHRVDHWSWNIFTLYNFCSFLIKQLINLEKVRTENLQFRTDLPDWVTDGWSVTQQMIVYKDQLLKISSNWKSKQVMSTLVTTRLSNIVFHLLPIWLQILVVINSESY